MNVSLTSLWLPILLSAVIVFIASSVIWMVIQYHNSEWKKLPDEEAARSALRGASPGQYSVPHAASAAERCTGIGLAIVHQLSQAMSGKVDVINKDPGAEFRVLFPVATAID